MLSIGVVYIAVIMALLFLMPLADILGMIVILKSILLVMLVGGLSLEVTRRHELQQSLVALQPLKLEQSRPVLIVADNGELIEMPNDDGDQAQA